MPFHDRIDVHAHFIPPAYRAACEEAGILHPDGMPRIPDWTEESHLQLMKTLSISKSILSISSPGTHLKEGDDALGRKVTRECNTYAADLCRRRPQQFGFWASLPVPDIEGCMAEIPYALDELNADGVTFETNLRGRYLGDAAFDPIFDELNRRHAKVFLHPTTPCVRDCHGKQGPHYTAALTQYPNPMFEFMFDTARAVINLFLSGTVARCPNITFIIPHAGGALVPLVQRFTRFAPDILGVQEHISNDVVRDTLRRQFYFDLAGLPFPDAIHGALRLVDASRLLYGSDYPFTNAKGCATLAEKMQAGLEELFQEDEWKSILVANAEKLLSK